MTNVRISRYGPSKSKRQGHIDFVYDTSVQFSMLALKDCKLFGKKMNMAPQGDMSSSSLHRALVKGPSHNSSTDVICLDDEILDIPESKNSNSSSRRSNNNTESSSRLSSRLEKNSRNFEKNSRQNNNNVSNSNNSGNNSRASSRNSNRTNSNDKSNNNNGREWSGWQEVIEVID